MREPDISFVFENLVKRIVNMNINLFKYLIFA